MFFMRYLLTFLFICTTTFAAPQHDERETLLSIVSGEWVAQGLYTATKLDLASHLMAGPKPVSDLARITDANEESLYRLMRLLASVGIFHEENDRVFSNSKTSRLLSRQSPQSLRSLVLFYSDEMSDAVRYTYDTVKEGIPGFELAYGQPVFAFFKDHPESAKLFNAAMKEKSELVINACLKTFDFGKFKSVYDIGGGTGHFLAAMLKAHPRLRGLLFEVPEVVESAKNGLEIFGKRCALIAGDFFKEIPTDGDAYLLKSVLHDWDDAQAVQILKKCRASMKWHSKLLIVEPLITVSNHPEYAKAMDLLMMTVTGGKERSEDDFRALLTEAGFQIDSITSTETEFAIIQASKR